MNVTVRSMIKPCIAATISIGLCLGTATTASAMIRYPVSQGSSDEGWYRASWNVQIAYSYIKTYSINHVQYCKAVQDGTHVEWHQASEKADCLSQAYGTGTGTHYDFVEYYTL